MTRRLSSDRIVGRTTELELGERCISALGAGEPSDRVALLLVAGEAGIGKSRLLAELLDVARRNGALVVCGRCLEHGGEVRPLSAVVELLSDLLPIADAGDVSVAADLRRLVDGETDLTVSDADTLARRATRLDAHVRALLHELARRQPIVLAIEDLHWGDQSTRQMLTSLGRSRGLERVLLIATYRSDELHRRHPLLSDLAEIERTIAHERIELSPLDAEAIAQMIADITGETVTESRAADVARRSGGNPFYAEELLATSGDEDRLPAGVRHVVLARARDLGADATRTIETAATLAAPVDLAVLQASTGLDEHRYRAAVDELCRQRLLIETSSGFRFRHDLVREVFLDELLPGERTALYERAASALERYQPERLGEIARLRAAGGQLADALRALVAAAGAAEAIGAAAEAADCYRRALDLWPRVEDPELEARCTHLELLRRAARSADLSRAFDEAVELGRLAAEAAADVDPFVEGAIRLELAQFLWNSTAPGLDAAIERAMEVIPSEPPSKERAAAEIRLARRLQFRGEPLMAEPHLERAVELAAAVGALGLEADARAALCYRPATLGDERALDGIRDAITSAIQADATEIATKLMINLTNTLVYAGRFAEAAEVAEDGVDLVERIGLMASQGILLQGNGLQALEPLGRWTEAESIVADINRQHGAESVHRWASALVGWGQIEINRGNYRAAASGYGRGFELNSSGYYSGDLGPLATGLIELAAADAVPPVSFELADSWFSQFPAEEAAAAARLAATAAEHLVPSVPAFDHERWVDAVTGWIGDVQRLTDAEYVSVPPVIATWLDEARATLDSSIDRGERWEAIARAWDDQRCPFFAARARTRQANAVLVSTGGRAAADRRLATRLLAEASEVADDLGARPLAEAILDLTRRARLSLPDRRAAAAESVAVDLPFGLTGRELEVLQLVADGRSNGEIGSALFVSRKTASVHVSNILRKLGASNRIEASAIARRHGLR